LIRGPCGDWLGDRAAARSKTTNEVLATELPIILQYSFIHTAPPGSFTDIGAIGIEPHADGSKDVRVDFLGGNRHMPFAPALGFNGNPALMFFLEHDAAGMREATGGWTGTIYQLATTVPPDDAQPGPTDDTMTLAGTRACEGGNECEPGPSLC
jgi:hypothetical protein